MSIISEGDVIILQRENYMKTQKITLKNPIVGLGRDSVDLSPILGHPYGSCFKMIIAENESSKKKKVFKIELVDKMENFVELFVDEDGGGADNRNIFDAAAFAQNPDDVTNSQKLSRDDIELMKEKGTEGSKIIEELIENSASFSQKTKFSQEKFVKKKSQKYFPYIMIRRPSIRLLSQIYYMTDPMKIMNLRIDSLAQMLNAANVRACGNYMVYETGCQGLLVSAVMDRLIAREGSEGTFSGKLIHIFETGCPQTHAVNSMNFSNEAIQKQISSLNLYHLRSLENGAELFIRDQQPRADGEGIEGAKPPHRQRLREESLASYDLMKQRNMDGLLIACRQHPTNILLSLMKYLAPSRPFVVFSPYQEPLMQTYMAVKETGKAVMVMLTETWLRNYQVLPDRTHPEVMMSGGGGYILSGIVVDNTDPQGFENGLRTDDGQGKSRGRKRNRKN